MVSLVKFYWTIISYIISKKISFVSTVPFRDGLPTKIKNKKGIEKNYYENFKRTNRLLRRK